MQVNLLSIVNAEGRTLPIDAVLDFSDKNEYGIDFFKPVYVSGVFTNIAGSIEFCGKTEFTARFMCDRCGEWFEESHSFEFSEILKKELDKESDGDENPDIIFYEGHIIDISDIIFNNIFMNLPSKYLCSEDCMGLCPHCGKNLNLEKCSCTDDVTDPRFDILDKFFKD